MKTINLRFGSTSSFASVLAMAALTTSSVAFAQDPEPSARPELPAPDPSSPDPSAPAPSAPAPAPSAVSSPYVTLSDPSAPPGPRGRRKRGRHRKHADDGAPQAAAADREPQGPPRKPDDFRLAAGARMINVTSPGLDPYSERDTLPFFSLEATKAFPLGQRWALALGAEWNFAQTSAMARGSDATLTAHRLGVPIEVRYYPAFWMHGFVRATPGATSLSATLEDASTSTAAGWVFSGDAMAGASFQVAPLRRPDKRLVRLWLTPEIGYAWSASRTMRFTEEPTDDDPRQGGTASLGSLALRGLTYRFSIALTY